MAPIGGGEWRRASGLQRAMLLASLRPERRGAYHQQLVVALREPVDGPVFLRAVQVCLARHAGLMARFDFRQGELFQSRIVGVELPAMEVELTAGSGTRDERLARFLFEDAASPLPVGTNLPLWRSTLVRFGPDDRVWVWSHHHALCDAACYRLLLRELFTTCDRMAAGRWEPERPAAPDFLDHLAWLEAQDWTPQKEAWQRRLSAADVPTPLPEVRAWRGEVGAEPVAGLRRVQVQIPPELAEALRALAAQADATLNTLLMAAWAFWVARMRSEPVVVFGAMRAARKSSIAGAESVIGPLVNTVPVRLEVPEDMGGVAWLRTVRREWMELRALEQCSLAQVMEWTGFAVGPAGLPVVVNFQRARLDAQLREAGLAERCEARLLQANDIPVMLSGCETPELEIEFVCRSDRVDGATAHAAARGLAGALRALASEPERPLGAIELLTAEDRKTLESASPGPRIEFTEAPAQALIERRIQEQPEAPALVRAGRTLSYRELGKMAGRMAAHVAALGGTGGVVAVLLPPSPEIVGVMLGVLRAGGAFFLLHPESPVEERAAMLRRLGVALAIVDDALVEETREVVAHVCRFAQCAATDAVPDAPPEIHPHDLAYLVHTSGSTGDKKFVEVEHRSLANALAALVHLYAIGPGDRRISRGLPGNDFFVAEVLVPLAAGATVVFPTRSGALSLADFLGELRRERITVTGLPASYWHEWVRAMDESQPVALPPELRLVISGMEKIDPRLLEKWRRVVGPRVRWLNVYGPAETTLVATAYELGNEPAGDPAHVSIGRPIGNTAVQVLDRRLRRLPVGVCGEIGIAGPGVARGYRGDEDTTRRKFVTDPCATAPEFSRLYRTGDYGYVGGDGQLYFVGRRDRQIKIRGHRVELGEIEAVLERHDRVRQAVVTAEGDEGHQRLVAHLVPAGLLDTQVLRAWLRPRLAAHLRPADFVVLERMPMMPTGKIDRRALSAKIPRRSAEPEGSAGATDLEDALIALWEELLGHRGVGRADSFFELGGNSLLAVRLLSRVEKDFAAAISLHDLFTHPTIEALARRISSGAPQAGFSALLRLNACASGRPLFIAHGWGGRVFDYVEFARRLHDTRPVYGLQAVEYAGQDRHRTLAQMAAHYADEISREQPSGPCDLLGYSLGGMVAYATACELAHRGHEVGTLFIIDTTPSNLPKWVRSRVVAVELAHRLGQHVATLLRTPARSLPDFIRARRRGLQNLVGSRPIPPNYSDYYAVLGTEFVPQPARFDLRLFTSGQDSSSMRDAWMYLTRRRVRMIPLKTGHFEVFAPENLDDFLAAFQQASATYPRSKATMGQRSPKA